ncbi:MAG: 4-oxalomesaconate tautomerase [Pseudohongiella sp.]|nr:4-oxalomesaconate tautomerase [Pseudohongiella sp.]
MQTEIPCMLMRGGTSKGLYFLASDLPTDSCKVQEVLLAAMGSPDTRQIDGVGGAHPLTSKVAIVSKSTVEDADVDYLFMQVSVDKPEVSASQNCGNLLAGVGAFAIEMGLVEAGDGATNVRIRMINTGSITVSRVITIAGKVEYEGDARIDGVPGTAAPVNLYFQDIAGSSCGALLPTGNAVDLIDGHSATCIDNGMPVVILDAKEFGKSGYETPDELESDKELKSVIESIRLKAGRMMNLGDVEKKTVPKMCLVAPARNGGHICTRNFIPHRVHEAIGVLGAVSIASACIIADSVANNVSTAELAAGTQTIDVEHPTGFFTVEITSDISPDGSVKIVRTALLRTARKIMQGSVFIPSVVWNPK